MQLYRKPGDPLSQWWVDKYETDAGKNWQRFYKQHGDGFFKDRHYLEHEWPQLRASALPRTFCEVGCGAGNTVLPLALLHPNAAFFACDFAPRAVELTQQRAAAAGLASRLTAFVCDVTRAPLAPTVPPRSCDAVTLIFALSAMAPHTMPSALAHVAEVLAKPHGVVCVRDYASGDLAMERLDVKQQKLGDSFYVRSDGTRGYYFTPEVLCTLFEAQGLVAQSCCVCEREIVNRGKQLSMERRWIQATFGWPSTEAPTEADGVVALGGELSALFATEHPASQTLLASAGRELTLQLVGREAQHTERATGLMCWEGSRALAEHLHAQPQLARGVRVLELGAGVCGLPSLAAAACGAASVRATDGHALVLRLLRENVAVNATEHARVDVRQLRWGHSEDLEAAQAEACDLLLAADVVYAREALPALFASAKAMLRAEGTLLLCHVADRGGVMEAELVEAARRAGVLLEARPLDTAVARLLPAMPPCRLLQGTLVC